MTLFMKSLAGGIASFLVVWILIVIFFVVRTLRYRTGPELYAVAISWEMLLRTPIVLLLLTAAFGFGLWVTARRGF